MTTRHDTLLWRCHPAMRSPGVYPTDGRSMSLRCAHKWCHPIETEDWRQLRRRENNDVWCATTFVLLNGGFSVCAQSFKEYGRLCIFSCGDFQNMNWFSVRWTAAILGFGVIFIQTWLSEQHSYSSDASPLTMWIEGEAETYSSHTASSLSYITKCRATS